MAINYNNIIEEYKNRKRYLSVYLTRSGKPEAYARERKGRGGFYNPKGQLMLEHRKDLLKSISKQERDTLKELISSDKEYYVELTLKYYVPVPKTDSKKLQTLKLNDILLPISRTGDLDNLDKFYLDTCHDVLYDDDKRVVRISAEKHYSIDPRVEITANFTIID
jgi:Holliday junction resolvase RusA-like endonuclease